MRKPTSGKSILGAAAVFIALSLWAMRVNGPPAHADELARAEVETCYGSGATGDGSECVGILAEVRDAAEIYGPLQDYKVESVKSRGILSNDYVVMVDAHRGGRSLHEAITVQTGRSYRLEKDYAIMRSMAVQLR